MIQDERERKKLQEADTIHIEILLCDGRSFTFCKGRLLESIRVNIFKIVDYSYDFSEGYVTLLS